ncbi:hypothetical protein [Promicromonospora iranensis]|uniref:Uncharacterized protein n=1 Tax=Promicromonospora iranensis TaxID=1105144 RepID=A0ABU2CPL3_9MICO|nr:hypothetical protein [Promicromonospora iranensis]MDR7383259.1 hypothetical protein [Promicromonospora iranensis]
MSIDDTDVLARLRAGADTVEEHRFDAHEVLAGSRRALRRRRSWQAVGACTTAAAVALSLALTGPVPVPGLGDVTLPGSEQVRELLGITEVSGCDVPERAVRRTPDPEVPSGSRPGVTYDLTDARPMSPCFDIRIDDVLAGDRNPENVNEFGAFWQARNFGISDGYLLGYQVFGTDGLQGELTSTGHTRVMGLTAQGRRAAWYEVAGETPEELMDSPYTLRTTTPAMGDTRTLAEIPRRDTDYPTMTAGRIAWRHGTIASVTRADGSGQPEVLARQATAVGSDADELVVATLGRDADGHSTTTFTSYGDGGSVATLLTVRNPDDDAPVSFVDITDDVLVYVHGSDAVTLTVVPRVDGGVSPDEDETITVRLTDSQVSGLSAAGDAVVWSTGPVAYLLRDTAPSRAAGPDLIRVGQGGPQVLVLIGLAGDRISWNTPGGSEAEVKVMVGTLLESGRPAGTTTRTEQAEPGQPGRAVRHTAAPIVTVPEDAVFRTYD